MNIIEIFGFIMRAACGGHELIYISVLDYDRRLILWDVYFYCFAWQSTYVHVIYRDFL